MNIHGLGYRKRQISTNIIFDQIGLVNNVQHEVVLVDTRGIVPPKLVVLVCQYVVVAGFDTRMDLPLNVSMLTFPRCLYLDLCNLYY